MWLEFKLTYYHVAVKHIGHNNAEPPSNKYIFVL